MSRKTSAGTRGDTTDEVSCRLPDRAGHQDARRDPAAQLRGRVPRREQAARAAAPRRRAERITPATCGAPTPTSRPTSPPAPASSSRTTAAAASARSSRRSGDAGGTLVYVLGVGTADSQQARGGAQVAVPRAQLPGALRAVRRPAPHRVQPLPHPPQGPAVPALLQRRRPRRHPAAQRPGPGRDGQRPGAAQRAAAHQADGGHRRAARRDAAREPADDEPARHPRRDHHAGAARRASIASPWSTCSRTTSAAPSTASTW